MIKDYHPSWASILEHEFAQEYFTQIERKVDEQRHTTTIYPSEENVFQAFKLTTFDQLKVVIIGQDPYHGPNQAHGLAFSVPEGQKIPPSLKNIFTELLTDVEKFPPHHGNLTSWAEQGVLLLNTALTVEAHKAGSHSKIGWHTFTQNIINALSQKKQHLVFILWGNHAQSLEKHIVTNEHLILKSAHPSPLSAHSGFWNNKHFSQSNSYLQQHQLSTINW